METILNRMGPVIAVLERDGQISNFYAIEHKLTLRLAARIADLKAKGYGFRTEMKDKNCSVPYFRMSSGYKAIGAIS